jgi:metal-sulfur cluster biosynthetic enzyme
MENPNPEIDADIPSESVLDTLTLADIDRMTDDNIDPVSADEIFSLLREIKDPEHPELSLSQLRVVRLDQISVQDSRDASTVVVEYTPTIPTCSVAVLIGLTLLKKLQLCVPSRFKIFVRIFPGTHVQEKQVNRQLSDKERVAAAMENPNLFKMVRNGVYKTDSMPEHLLIW